jgi:hypothetical protein
MNILVTFGRNYLDVPGHLLEQLLQCKVYVADGYYRPYTWTEAAGNEMEILTVLDSELFPEPTTLNIESIMEENSRLTRENEKLIETLDKLKSDPANDTALATTGY